jgi:SPP1 family predicted phage head-tail adaptor
MRPVRIGEHRARVTLQNPVTPEVYDSFGQPSGAFVTVGTFWAFVRPLTGAELVAASQVKSRGSIAVRTRWQGLSVQVTSQTRLIINGQYYGLVSVNNPEMRNRSYEMIAYEMLQGESP